MSVHNWQQYSRSVKMAESLRRLVNIGTFNVLGEKLERWLDNYYINTCDQNVARCCEIIELNAKVQGQLFKLLSVCAGEGGLYGGTSAIKNRLLPFLGHTFFTSGTTTDSSLNVIADATSKNRELDEIQDMYERSMADLESDLKGKDMEIQDLRDELSETKDRIISKERTTTTDKLFIENENRDLRRKLAAAEDECRNLRSKAGLLSDYDTQVRRLRDDIALLTGRRDALLRTSTSVKEDLASYRPSTPSKLKSDEPLALGFSDAQDEIVKLRARSSLVDDLERQVRNMKDERYLSSSKKSYLDGDTYDSLTSYRYTPRAGSPLSIDDPVQRVRQGNLIARWNDNFSQDRLDAMDTLRRYSDDYENNQRIIFSAVQESFHAAKMAFSQFKMKVRANLLSSHYGPETLEEAVQDYVNRNSDLYDLPGMVSEAFSVAKLAFRQFKMKVRANLAITHMGPDSLEEGVQDYVNRNCDLYDLPGMVSDVIRALNRNPRIFLPPDATFAVIQPFIREAVKVAWQMSALAHPLDMAVATDAELYDSTKYRRSYDSEYTAPLVNHHIWPSLMQGARCTMKGECVTRRGASLSSARRSRSPTRSLSPGPRSRSRSRSLSPTRRSRSSSPKRY